MANDLDQRLRRIYAAIDATLDRELSDVVPKVTHGTIHISFHGQIADEQLANIAHAAIANIAHFRDHLRKWAKRANKQVEDIERAVEECLELRVLIDLANSDKHGYPPRDGGLSRLAPRLEGVTRAVVFGGGEKDPSEASVQIVLEAERPVSLHSTAYRAVVARIVDQDGRLIGQLHEFLEKGIDALERLLKGYGLVPRGES